MKQIEMQIMYAINLQNKKANKKNFANNRQEKQTTGNKNVFQQRKSKSPLPKREMLLSSGSAYHFIRKSLQVKCYTCKGKGHISIDYS